jgi:histidinol-phosphate aminotransferase
MTPLAPETRTPGSLATVEKGGATFEGLRLLLCENPLPPLDEAIAAAREALPLSNYYTEPYSAPLRSLLARLHDVPERLIHINAGSELILRQLFDRHGARVVMTSPTYALFPEVAQEAIPIDLAPANDLAFDLARLEVPGAATLVVIVNPSNPTGQSVDLADLPVHLTAHPDTIFIVDEAFIDLGGRSVVRFVPEHDNLIVTRTLSKAHSLAGFRVGYAICPPTIADDLNAHNDAYPLARPSQAAAIATLEHPELIAERLGRLRAWAQKLAADLRVLGVRTFPSETYFFVADFAPHDASVLAARLRTRGILMKPLGDARLGPGFMRVTTALPEQNAQVLDVLRELLATDTEKG